jgi:hypothetical protein
VAQRTTDVVRGVTGVRPKNLVIIRTTLFT